MNHCQDIFQNSSQQTGTNPHLGDSLTRPSHNSIFSERNSKIFGPMSHSRIFMILFIHDSNKLSRSSLTLCDREHDASPASVSLYKLLTLAIFSLMLNMLKLSTCVNILTATRGLIFADVTCWVKTL